MIDIVNYNNSVLPIGLGARKSLNLISGQEVYVYEDTKNKQIILSAYKFKNTLYRSVLYFNQINDYIGFGFDLANNRINILSINFFKHGDRFRATIVYEIVENLVIKPDYRSNLDEHNFEFNKNNIKDSLEELAANYHIEIKEFVEYTEKEENEKVKNIIFPLMTQLSLNEKILRLVRISQNFTIYYNLSEEFKRHTNLKNYNKCVQIIENDLGILILKFYDSDTECVNIKLLNLPGSFIRLMNICNFLEIEIHAIHLQRMSFAIGGSAETLYIIKYPENIRKDLKDSKNRENDLKKKLNEADSELIKRDKDNIQTNIVDLHEKYLELLKSENREFVKSIELHNVDTKKKKKIRKKKTDDFD